ncbi:hypothetical protein HRR83_000482 [Exophiala dermatitidis]|nr:hypothetical protein HRR75_000438 [Exophiala dermatitidis]KAJ4538956.1 hypothetical protein HRR78_007881 [Exophiala dermatitidis]KAJ4558479.1 hypothetical protein HRR77_000483 [Exophiala dermatitidis]KAJ4581485.1 hypothetical protein HRR79_000513 [Exophiala dermatitidis]KAJ4584707.1 hypothetical protein HRR81_000513 [Exophiala dermatitidis]
MAINVIYWVSILSGHYLPDRFGRRPLLMSTALYCAITLLIISIINTTIKPPSSATSKAAIALEHQIRNNVAADLDHYRRNCPNSQP